MTFIIISTIFESYFIELLRPKEVIDSVSKQIPNPRTQMFFLPKAISVAPTVHLMLFILIINQLAN
ncbi:MAG: hypothetical protein LBT66_02850 [Methanobrevibacter sp.]|nr:hypothetical protein [Candidatus Methanovirga meridionalis]